MQHVDDLYGLRCPRPLSPPRPTTVASEHCSACRRARSPASPSRSRHDPTFALGQAGLALLGHEYCASVDIERPARGRPAARRARHRARTQPRARGRRRTSRGDSRPLIRHLREYPRDAAAAVGGRPDDRLRRGHRRSPQESWAIVERPSRRTATTGGTPGCSAFIRQEQCRWDEAMALSCRSLELEPAAGHSVHARTHVHYETGDHQAGLTWLDGWIHGVGQSSDNLAHYSWHAALHELSMGDFAAVQHRYAAELAPPTVVGCRALVDSCSLLWRWAITPGAVDVPRVEGRRRRRSRTTCSTSRRRRSWRCTPR